MKRTTMVALVALLILVLTSGSATQLADAPFAYVDFGDPELRQNAVTDDTFKYPSLDFCPDLDGYAVAYLYGSQPELGECRFWWDTGVAPRQLELVVLDRGVQDSFYVEMKNPHQTDKYVKVYSYTADGTAPPSHVISKFPFGLRTGKINQLKIRVVPMNPSSDYYLCGQVPVDRIELYGTTN